MTYLAGGRREAAPVASAAPAAEQKVKG
jgi:hypothetical protein